MNPADVLPLLVVGLLLVGVSGADVSRMETVLEGNHTVTAPADAVIVVGGNVTVPSGTTLDGSLYLLRGAATIDGIVTGDVVHLRGTLDVTGRIDGTLQLFGTDPVIAPTASVKRTDDVADAAPVPGPGPVQLLLQAALLGVVAAAIGGRYPRALDNVTGSIRDAPATSLTVGGLASAILLALAVFMAFTIILIPVSILLLATGVIALGYVHVLYGDLVGGRLPIGTRRGQAAAGTVLVVIGLRAVSMIPVIGGTVQILILMAGLGALFLSGFGLRRFEPPDLGA